MRPAVARRGVPADKRPDQRRAGALGSPDAGAGRLPDGDIHGSGRKLDRRHRDADHRCRSGWIQPVLVGIRGLPADPGGEHSRLWPACRHLRPQEGVLFRGRPVPGRFHAVRLCRQHGGADPVPCAARLRCRWRAADRHHDPWRHLHADRARPRAGPGVQRVRCGRRAGPIAWRFPGRTGELATGVLGQSADRRGSDRNDRDISDGTNRAASAPHRLSGLAAADGGDHRADAGAGAGRQPAACDAGDRWCDCDRNVCSTGGAREQHAGADVAAGSLATAPHHRRSAVSAERSSRR